MNILLARSRELAYSSASFFMDRMADALSRAGHSTSRLDVDVFGEAAGVKPDTLEYLDTASYDAVVDFNSNLPRLETEDGIPWLDTVGVPFYNYVIDHPIYHDRGLSVLLKDYNVICIDRLHAEYIREHYPHVKRVSVLPLAGTKALLDRSFEEKESAVLIPATYDANTGRLPKEMPEFIIRDQMKRNRERYECAFHAAESGVEVALMGYGWDETPLADYPNVRLLPPRPMMNAVNTMARYKYVMDVNPLFPCGMHDRVPAAMINGSLCITTMNPEFDNGLRDGENIVYYREDMSFDIKKAAAIARAGQQYCDKHYSWEKHAGRLVEILAC